MLTLSKNQIAYMEWLKARIPLLYNEVLSQVPPPGGMSSLGDTTSPASSTSTSWWDQAVGAVKELAPVYIATKQQEQVNQLNLARAQSGQPPIDSATAAPSVSAQVGLSPNTMRMVYIGVAVVGGALVLPSLMKGKR